VEMLGHDYVTQQGELISGTQSVQDLHKNRAVGGIAERSASTVATARDEMQVFQVVVAMEAARHAGILARGEAKVVEGKKSPTLALASGEDGAPGDGGREARGDSSARGGESRGTEEEPHPRPNTGRGWGTRHPARHAGILARWEVLVVVL
jgi:hypothetical protein